MYQKGRGTKSAGPRIRLPNDSNSAEFYRAYAQACGVQPTEPTKTVDKLIVAYRASREWTQLAASTRRDYERYLARISAAWGRLDPASIEPHHVVSLRDVYSDAPGAANALVRSLSALLSWGVPRNWRKDNPCRDIPKYALGDGAQPWSWEVIKRAELGLPAHMWQAAALALYTGQRQSDVLGMQCAAIRDGRISVKQDKTNKELTISVHRNLQAILSIIGIDRDGSVLRNTRGLEWTGDGFRASWATAKSNIPELEGFTFHGLRKSAVVFLLEAGCTEAETAAITGQTMQMVAHYAKGVNQQKLAAAGMLKWEQTS